MSQLEPPKPPAIGTSWLDAIQETEPKAPLVAAPTLTAEELFLEQMRSLQIQDFRQDIAARKSYANKLFILISAWLVAIFLVLVVAGFGGICTLQFKLSDAVLLGLIGSTTATVIGLFLVVVNYLFPQRKEKPTVGG